jgi:small subunit ribosomal protein S4
VRHAHFTVNGKKVDIPSYEVRPDDVIALRPNSKAAETVRVSTDLTSSVAPWLLADHDNLTGKILRVPERDEIDAPVQEQLIVELYSK